jgi:hypothetical protein
VHEQWDVLRIVTERLERASIPYMVTGAIALAYYLDPRQTRDIDIVELQLDDSDRVVDLFSPDFYCDSEAVRRAISQRRLFNIIHLERIVKVDLIVRKADPYSKAAMERRHRGPRGAGDIWIATAEDLLLAKLQWVKIGDSHRQLVDLKELIEKVSLDWDYVERWAEELNVSRLLGRLRGNATSS